MKGCFNSNSITSHESEKDVQSYIRMCSLEHEISIRYRMKITRSNSNIKAFFKLKVILGNGGNMFLFLILYIISLIFKHLIL